MKHGLATLSLVLIAGAVFAAVQANLDQYSWNYKITVNIETPEGVKTGSAVRQVLNRDNTILGQKIPEAPSRLSSVKGEAVVIDLGERGVVFALPHNDLYSAFPTKTPASLKGVEYYNSLPIGTKAELPKESWPRMSMFKDMDDPESVTLLYGWEFNPETQKQYLVQAFEEKLGEGFKVHSITIEIVDEPVSWGTVDRYIDEDFWNSYRKITKSMNIIERAKKYPSNLFQFKQGE